MNVENAKPILFNTEMVQAILNDSKHQTRRIIKFPKDVMTGDVHNIEYIGPDIVLHSFNELWHQFQYFIEEYPEIRIPFSLKPRYQIDDVLYVRETWNYGRIESTSFNSSTRWFESVDIHSDFDFRRATSQYFYRADNFDCFKELDMPWRPSIHMPKEAARIFLRILNITVERLNDICEEDAADEGIKEWFVGMGESGWATNAHADTFWESPVGAFADLWNKTAQKDEYKWKANPYVWVYTFERIEA